MKENMTNFMKENVTNFMKENVTKENVTIAQKILGLSHLKAYPLLDGTTTDKTTHSKDVLGRLIDLNNSPQPIYYYGIDISDALSRYKGISLKVASITGNSDAINDENRVMINGDIAIWREIKIGKDTALYPDQAVIISTPKSSGESVSDSWCSLRRVMKFVDKSKVKVKTKAKTQRRSKINTEIIDKKDIIGEVLFSFKPQSRIVPRSLPALFSYSAIDA